jgi:hypothetical protein
MILDADDPNAEPPEIKNLPPTRSPMVTRQKPNGCTITNRNRNIHHRARPSAKSFLDGIPPEIVPDGGLTDDGKPTYGNAERRPSNRILLHYPRAPIENRRQLCLTQLDKIRSILDGGVVSLRSAGLSIWLGNLAVEYSYGRFRRSIASRCRTAVSLLRQSIRL